MRAAILAMAVALLLAVPASAKAPSGKFRGTTEQNQSFMLMISGKRMQYSTFAFKCRKVKGVTATISIQDFAIKKGRDGVYRLKVFAYASVNYSDDQGYENAKVHLNGRFSKSGRSAAGTVRVEPKRCGDTGALDWHARR